MWNKRLFNLIIYHKGCNDGFGSAAIAFKFLKMEKGENWVNDNVIFHPAYHGSKPPNYEGKDVLILDYSYDSEVMKDIQENSKSLFIIDHHKTAYDRLKDISEDNYLLRMEKSGVGLTWEYFTGDKENLPLFLQYIQDRDIWTNKLEFTDEIFQATNFIEKHFLLWEFYIDYFVKNGDIFYTALGIGRTLLKNKNNEVSDILNKYYKKIFQIKDKKYNVAYINSPIHGSDLGHNLLQHFDDIDFAAIWTFDGQKTRFSLRSRENGTDVSKIAELYNGGGHFCAAGCSLNGFHSNLPGIIQEKSSKNLEI